LWVDIIITDLLYKGVSAMANRAFGTRFFFVIIKHCLLLHFTTKKRAQTSRSIGTISNAQY